MNNLLTKFYYGADGIKKFICLLVFTIYIGAVVYGGGSAIEMLLLFWTMVGYVWLPGKFWNTVLKANTRFEELDFGQDILLGTGFFCAVYCVAMRLHMRALLVAVPPVFALLCIFLVIRRGYLTPPPEKLSGQQWLLVLLFFALLLLYTFTGSVKNALPVNVGDTLLKSDMLWNVGNANSFTLRFIPEDIRYSGVQLHYHYLTELFAGALAWLTGISAYNIVAFYMQPFVLVCVVYCLYSFGKVFFKDTTKAVIFTYSMFIFSCGSLWGCFLTGYSKFYNDNAYHIITNINSQATAIIFLCIFASMFIQLLRKNFDCDFFQLVLFLAAFFMLSFGKGPVAAIVAIGTSIVLFWTFIQRKISWKGPVAGILLAGLFFVIYMLFFASGANTSMAFSIWGTLSKSVLGGFLDKLFYTNVYLWYICQIIAMFLLVVAFAPLQGYMFYLGLWKDIKNLFRLSGERLWINSMIAGGFMAYYLFNHYAMSQVYFAFLALFFLHLIAIDNLDLLAGKVKKWLFVAMAVVSIATTCFMYTNYIGSGARFMVRNLGLIEKYPYHAVINQDDQQAMEFFRENSPENALFATNRIDESVLKKDGISNVYSAFSGRQSYMEGYAYALTNMGVPYYVITQRQEINEKLFSGDTSAEELQYLCQSTGITHLVLSTQFTGDDSVIASIYEKIYDSETVKIYATGVTPFANHPLYQEELAEYSEGIKDE